MVQTGAEEKEKSVKKQKTPKPMREKRPSRFMKTPFRGVAIIAETARDAKPVGQKRKNTKATTSKKDKKPKK